MVADGGAYTTIDTAGATWPNVIMTMFAPQGRAYQVVGIIPGFLARKYTAEFLHVF